MYQLITVWGGIKMSRDMTGYDNEDRYFATRYKQGKRTVNAIDLSLSGVVNSVAKPDPKRPTEGNRQISESHARDFAKYVRENEDWVCPPLLLRSSNVFTFEQLEKIPEIKGIEFGILSLPRRARNDLKILDGQHRILGLHFASEDIASELEKRRGLLAAARRQENAELIHVHEAEIKKLETQRSRMDRERIGMEIYIEDDPEEYKQMFVDIADNALGIKSAIRARFDHRKVVNRALDTVLKHALLDGRVDLQQDRVVGTNSNFLGAKHVADVIRTVAVGVSGRIGRRQESDLRDDELAERANDFFDVLTASFPVLNDLIEEKITPEQLRNTSLLGSATMLRVLAGVYHKLAQQKSDDEVIGFFSKLARYMKVPVPDKSPWLEVKGDVFSVGAKAPKARYQDMEELTNTIVKWSQSEPEWLEAA
jgi:hypothetical protein